MGHDPKDNRRLPGPGITITIGALIVVGLLVAIGAVNPMFFPVSGGTQEIPQTLSSTMEVRQPVTVTMLPVRRTTPTLPTTREPQEKSPTPTRPAPTPTRIQRPTATAIPTLDLARCNAAGCGLKGTVLPTAEYNFNLFLTEKTPTRRVCADCPKNEQLSETRLNALIAADGPALARLRQIALSQETYELAPGIVYIVFDNVHHVVVDLKEAGYVLRNIIPNTSTRGTLITPSYCLSPQSLVVITADYHGLNGSNKTETGRDIFFHLGRAALFKRDDRFDIDVIRQRVAYDRTTISWGGGPIFIWNGHYDYNPEQEWFEAEALEHYRKTHWTKLTVALSQDRKYLFISASYGLTLAEHAQNIIDLGKKWGIKVDRAMRFDGSESAYLAIRLGDYMAPVLNLEEPLIVNCLAIEAINN